MWDDCGTICPITCDNYDSKPFCADVCVPGCFCKKGYILNNGTCVKPHMCPSEYFFLRLLDVLNLC